MWKPPKGPEQVGLGHANPHLVHEGPEARNTNCLVSLLENMFALAFAFTVSLSLYCPFVILWSLRLFLSLFFLNITSHYSLIFDIDIFKSFNGHAIFKSISVVIYGIAQECPPLDFGGLHRSSFMMNKNASP